jgi:hypothetical protein
MSLVRALRNADADAASRRALALAATLPPGRALAKAAATESYLRMLNRDYDDAIAWGAKAIALAERQGDVATHARALLTLGAATMFVDYVRGCEQLAKSLALARSLDDGDAAVADAHVMLGTASGELHAFAAAERYLDEGIAFARARDLDRLAGYMEAWQSLVDVFRGRWALAGERANAVAARELAGTTNRVVALIALGRLRTRRGDPGAAEVLDEALALAERSGTLQRLGPVCAARAEAAWMAGDDARAAREAGRAFDLAAAKRHPWLLGELAFWRYRAGSLAIAAPGSAEPFALQMAGRWSDAAAAWRAMGCPVRGSAGPRRRRRGGAACRARDPRQARRQAARRAHPPADAPRPASARCRAARRRRRAATRPASPRASSRCSRCSPTVGATPRSRHASRARPAPSSTTSNRSSPSSRSARAPRRSRRRAGSDCSRKMGSRSA